MVFQSYALYPHMTIRDNIGYPRIRGMAESDRNQMVDDVAKSLEVEHLLDRRPRQLSGVSGSASRWRAIVQIPSISDGRAFVKSRRATRLAMRGESSACATAAATTIYVTHDQADDDHDLVAVMGRFAAAGGATEKSTTVRPTVSWLFVGSPPMNFVSSKWRSSDRLRRTDRGVSAALCGAINTRLLELDQTEDIESFRPTKGSLAGEVCGGADGSETSSTSALW
jgi:ABC-type sugar transport system ATPase subunit